MRSRGITRSLYSPNNMDITSELLPNPLYHPLPPSVDDLVTYADEMDYEGHLLTFEWADYEIKNHLFGYVRVGLAAEKVRFYRLYKGRFKDFRDYCEKGLGRSLWMVNRLIDAAKVVMELVRAGFTQLPTCESQTRPLVKYLKQAGNTLVNKWEEVIASAPPHHITTAKVAEIVDNQPQNKKQRVNIRSTTLEKLKRAALDAGMSLDDYLDSLVVQDFEPMPPEPNEENEAGDAVDDPEKTSPVSPIKVSQWLEDMQQLLMERGYLVQDIPLFGLNSS